MINTEINTTSEWMSAMAIALNNNDMEMAERLDRISSDWLQSDEERRAQNSLFIAVSGAIEEIEDLKEENESMYD